MKRCNDIYEIVTVYYPTGCVNTTRTTTSTSTTLAPTTTTTSSSTSTSTSSTTTTTTTVCEGNHPYTIYIGFATSIYDIDQVDFYQSFAEACTASKCITSIPGCAISSFFLPYSDNPVLSLGDVLYNNSTGCNPMSLSGFFIQSSEPTVIIEVINGIVINFLNCPTTTTTTTVI